MRRTRLLPTGTLVTLLSLSGGMVAAAPPEPDRAGPEHRTEAGSSNADKPSGDLHMMLTFGEPMGWQLRPRATNISSGTVNQRLLIAWPLAVRRVRELPGCSALFEDHGRDGVKMLTSTLYSGQGRPDSELRCGTSITAFTWIGSPRTVLCNTFADLPTTSAAMILIHEALHYAGLGESPPIDGAPTSNQINTLVRNRCDL